MEGLGGGIGRDQFNAVTKRIICEGPPDGRKRSVFGNLESFALKTSNQFLELLDEKCGMCLLCWTKAIFDPEMNLDAATLKPSATATG
ncbi:MAG: hypothetical protein Tsb007_46100 [Rhizobacter sp.]